MVILGPFEVQGRLAIICGIWGRGLLGIGRVLRDDAMYYCTLLYCYIIGVIRRSAWTLGVVKRIMEKNN